MRTSLDVQKPGGFVPTTFYDTVVVGAGPYGLSTTAQLLGRGVKVAIFGRPVQLWREKMPLGMLLRSAWWATNLSDPQKKYDLSQYFLTRHLKAPDPLSRETFIDYALWFQRQAVPNADETYVTRIERKESRFEVTLEDGRVIECGTVVLAPGLAYYVNRPVEYNDLPSELVSHTADHAQFDSFAGKQVIVIGGGQSALESAALLREAGARVHLVSRSPLRWLADDTKENRSFLARLKLPKAGIAPGWFNLGLERFPYAFQRLPRKVKDRLLRGRAHFGPAGAYWLRDRIEGKVTLHELRRVQELKVEDHCVMLRLSDNTSLKADHILLATGYQVDINRLPMLSASLLSRIQTHQNAPILNSQFESSVPGLYFIGISSLLSFGPLYRFVLGTDAAARRVAASVARRVVRVK